jgi:hypothetical protein
MICWCQQADCLSTSEVASWCLLPVMLYKYGGPIDRALGFARSRWIGGLELTLHSVKHDIVSVKIHGWHSLNKLIAKPILRPHSPNSVHTHTRLALISSQVCVFSWEHRRWTPTLHGRSHGPSQRQRVRGAWRSSDDSRTARPRPVVPSWRRIARQHYW